MQDNNARFSSEKWDDHLGNVLEKVIWVGEEENCERRLFQSQVHVHTCCSSMYNHITVQDKGNRKAYADFCK